MGQKAVLADKDGNQIYPVASNVLVQPALFTDLADVAKNLDMYAGTWSVEDIDMTNAPFKGKAVVTVKPMSDDKAGYIAMHDLKANTEWHASIQEGLISDWKRTSGEMIATLIPAKANLNNYTTPGIYDSGDNAATVLNGITNPSIETGHAFILTVTADAKGTMIQQDLKTYTGWAFTRTIHAGRATIWTAYSGTMNVTVEGPFKSAINLVRTGNNVIARIVNVTQGLGGGQQSTESIPSDYVPTYVINKVPNMTEAIIRSYYENRVLTVQSDGTIKNFGSEEFKGTGYGEWPIIA
ncbi:glutathione synthetase [Weissella oryzae SG25]|uniref:Glutathione synthetase n=1 Tax=Weissella oryzae (strain DSM 25784 / JCM 18191 / LMG 30913 / SG25) TaxID=1329250 RepID=A0A069CUB6_WEIOS|nr:pyocin knob domain-containing protein [Weissella oryzae]GAK30997.1 glutathione synthetase [Weissella oryzae SG25]